MNGVSFWKDMAFACSIMVLFLFIHEVHWPEVRSVQAAMVSVPIEVPPAVPQPQFSAREIQCLRNVIYGEARGESRMTQIAVAATVINRALSAKWPDDLCDVATQKNQFHGYKAIIRLNNDIDIQSWDTALDIANYTALNYYSLPKGMQTALYFRSDGDRISWAKKFRIVAELGRLTFYG
jgi:spore germination cell wall hydrolase CwlJ-like protein